jgi:hypothetical protein
MTLSYKILCTISCVSFSLCAMEQQTVSTTHSSTQTQSNQKYYYSINDLYKNTYLILKNYNPRDEQSIKSIFSIIDATTKLQNDGCEEDSIGRFAYNQHLQQQERNNKTSLLPSKNFDTMPLYISVFFERITQHKAHLKKNEFTAPTIEQFMVHKKIPFIQGAIQTAANFRVIINLQKIDPNNTIMPTFPNAITDGIHEHEKLMEDINTMLQTDSISIKNVADILYIPKL